MSDAVQIHRCFLCNGFFISSIFRLGCNLCLQFPYAKRCSNILGPFMIHSTSLLRSLFYCKVQTTHMGKTWGMWGGCESLLFIYIFIFIYGFHAIIECEFQQHIFSQSIAVDALYAHKLVSKSKSLCQLSTTLATPRRRCGEYAAHWNVSRITWTWKIPSPRISMRSWLNWENDLNRISDVIISGSACPKTGATTYVLDDSSVEISAKLLASETNSNRIIDHDWNS